MRAWLVLLHRYVGLVLVLYLALTGLTGSLLAYNDALELAISPRLFRVQPAPGASPIDPLLLRAQVQELHPDARVPRAPLAREPGRSVVFQLRKAGKAGPPNDQVFVDPYTGRVLGERKWGDIRQGRKNLMPFVYRLHYCLALGAVGTAVFGVLALLWTLDCLVGAWLTFPARRRSAAGGPSWPRRWWPSWAVRRAGAYKLAFDLHRAGGLWTWALLFVLAWSSVAFNLPQVYEPAMRAVLAHQPAPAPGTRPAADPGLSWTQALERARALMAERAAAGGWRVLGEKSLIHDPGHGIFRYDVLTDRDIDNRGGHTRLAIDADTGAPRGLWLPTGAASGDTVTTWITALHRAAVWGWPLRLLVCAMGLVVTLLGCTGFVIWRRKRAARKSGRQGRVYSTVQTTGYNANNSH